MMRRCLLLLFTLLLLAQPASALSDAVPSDQTLFEQALAASRQGEAAEALSLWDAFLARHPEDAAAWSNRGNVRLVLGDPEGAIADQSEAIALAPDAIDPHLNRGTAEEALQRWSEAAADYNWILEFEV